MCVQGEQASAGVRAAPATDVHEGLLRLEVMGLRLGGHSSLGTVAQRCDSCLLLDLVRLWCDIKVKGVWGQAYPLKRGGVEACRHHRNDNVRTMARERK